MKDMFFEVLAYVPATIIVLLVGAALVWASPLPAVCTAGIYLFSLAVGASISFSKEGW